MTLSILPWLIAVTAPPALSATSQQTASDKQSPAPDENKIKARIESLQGNTGEESSAREAALSLYQRALSDLHSGQNDEQSAQNYRKALEQAPRRLQSVHGQGERNPAIDREHLQGLPLAELENRLKQARADQSGARSKLSSLEARIAQMQAGPDQTRKALDQAEEQTLNTPGPQPDDPAVLAEAKQTLQRAQRFAHAQHIDMLQQKLLSHGARLNLLQAEQKQARQAVNQASRRVDWLEKAAHERRASQARHLAQSTDRTKRQSQNQPPPLPALTQENAELGKQIASLVPGIVQVGSRRDELQKQTQRLKQRYESTQKELNIAEHGQRLGKVLQEQLKALPETNQIRSNLRKRKEKIAEARLMQYQIQKKRRELGELGNEARQRLATQGLSAARRARAESQLREVLAERGTLLERSSDFYQQYIDGLVGLVRAQKQLLDTTQRFSALLQKNLLWTASAEPAGIGWLKDIARGTGWLLAPTNWAQAGESLWLGFKEIPWLGAGAVLLIIAVAVTRRRARNTLDKHAQRIGNVTHDRFRYTIAGLGITVLLALPVALVLALGGTLIIQSPHTQNFSAGVGHGLVNAAVLILFFESFRQFCKNEGVADKHFNWPDGTRNVLVRNFWWLLVLELPLTMLVSLASHGTSVDHNGLGRLAFVAASIALSVFFWRVLHPRRGAASKTMQRESGAWPHTLRLFVFPAAVAIPLSMALLTLSGYYTTALTLESRFYYSAWLFVGIIISVGLTLRWLNVASRRLALKRARARREAALAERAGKDGDGSGGEGQPENLDIPEIDLDTINEQTRKFLGLFVAIALAIGLWSIWSDLLPALGMLDNITLWHISIGSGTSSATSTISLQDLLFSLVAIALTLAAGRNLPGLLEISVLQRFKVDAGNRYAITTVSRYVITIIGLFVALKLIGIGWSQAHWLVAALGVGLGFGLQEIFANFVSGLIIFFERPIRIGDTVTVDGTNGTVSRIRIRATTITDWDRRELIVPNKTFVTSQLTNWTLSDDVQRVVIPIGIGRDADPEQATEIMRKAVKAHPLTLEDPPPLVLFRDYGESTLNFQVRAFVDSLDNWLPLTHELNANIHRDLGEAGVNIAYPQRDLHIRSWQPPVPWDSEARERNEPANDTQEKQP